MTDSELRDLRDALTPDEERPSREFSDDMKVQQGMWETRDDTVLTKMLSDWLQMSQPCLFGRIAAKNRMLRHVFISDSDVDRGDVAVRDKIQSARLEWSRAALEGREHGFIVHLVSERVALAAPSEVLQRIATRLCSLYLLEDVIPNTIHTETVFLRGEAGQQSSFYEWDAGVNVFMTQGDRRWWADHRIPGGMAFSVNSVGHMVKSGRLRELSNALLSEVGGTSERGPQVATLSRALDLAKRTIMNAAETISGKATCLVSDGADGTLNSHYVGFYHTDHTVPSGYFDPRWERPVDASPVPLDLTYLHDKSVSNVDHLRLGVGRRIMDSTKAKSLDGRHAFLETSPRLRDVLRDLG